MSINFPLNQDITRIDPDFVILSDANLVDTMDLPMDSTLIASGFVDGETVCTDIYGNLVETDATTAVRNSFFVYDGSKLATDVPYDTVASEKLTVITNGGWLAKTKNYAATPGVGAFLAGKNGSLEVVTGADIPLAIAVVYAPISDGYLYIKAL